MPDTPYVLTDEDKADLAHWEAKRASALAGLRRGCLASGFALIGIVRQCEWIRQHGTPKLLPPSGPFIRKVKP